MMLIGARSAHSASAHDANKPEPVPAVEWWDQPLLRSVEYDGAPGGSVKANALLEVITHYVEHPVPVQPPAEPPPPPPQPLPLTARERKKLRTQRRLAAERERQDQVRAGLMPPPPPKVKLSNMMRVLKDEAVADPSALEARVRAEVAQRAANHEQRNLASKNTAEEARAKRLRKLLNDPTSGGMLVSLYRIDRVPSRRQLFKIEQNARDNHMTGILLVGHLANLVVVEGGPKAQRRYRRLLLHRIDWSESAADVEEEGEEASDDEGGAQAAHTACRLVWEGTVLKPYFRTLRVEAPQSLEAARKLLREARCEHYWDMALSVGEAHVE